MTKDSLASAQSPPAIADFLFARRESILNSWRTTCELDKTIQTVSNLSREEFNDMVPTILNILGQRLHNQKEESSAILVASEHGLHRWHKGYTLRELLKEIGHLFEEISNELKTYQELYPASDPKLFVEVYPKMLTLYEETVEGSAARYDELERTAAASRADTLQSALDQLNDLTRQRNDLLRTSSHDLRSSVGIAQGAAFMLDFDNQSPEERAKLIDMLNRNLASIESMLQSLMSLARLEAGQETVEVGQFDVGKLLHELAERMQPFAQQQRLPFLVNGPEKIAIESDAEKISRIVQNLLMNALTYTTTGVVSLSWVKENDRRFTVSVQDTGPGLSDTMVSSLVGALKPTQDSALVFDSQVLPIPPLDDSPGAPRTKSRATSKGEGVGLHIVKRLCEMLEANLDVETAPGKGTLIRVRFPTHYRKVQT
ncbi:hypothetical protein GCM10028806_23650 [Spirosoma terrae]|uniref:histidine kinase n=1 Tax=Spirosoma terrae TaxID=1968276 RepID=A0A6L9L1C7_9BACT|nr:HAMP domain-containing sensor histidine kinase [Spirosoma terrae]NDU94325.1 HAMP domain-containing histidine kinase [Spirosoma terrae]